MESVRQTLTSFCDFGDAMKTSQGPVSSFVILGHWTKLLVGNSDASAS